MLLQIINHLKVDLRVFIEVEGELADECIEVLDEVGVDWDLGFLGNQGNGLGDYPFFGGDAGDALVDEGETR